MIDDSFDTLRHSTIFSTLDLANGYWQVELGKATKEKASIMICSELYEWEVLLFGLTSAPTFGRLIKTILRGLHWQTVLIYLNNINVFAPDVYTHKQLLEEVFSWLRAAHRKLKLEKCALFANRVKYLRHTVSGKGAKTDDDKITAINSWSRPNISRVFGSFFGTCYTNGLFKDILRLSHH